MIRLFCILLILSFGILRCSDSGNGKTESNNEITNLDSISQKYNPLTGEFYSHTKDDLFKLIESYDDSISIVRMTSFGMCYGYCKKQSLINRKGIAVTISSWDTESKLKHESYRVDSLHFEKIIKALKEANIKDGYISYGCPDCWDQGAEYFEVNFGEIKMSISCEFHQEIFEYNNLLTAIRDFTD